MFGYLKSGSIHRATVSHMLITMLAVLEKL
ncbi:MAG: hypothetical protein LZF86_240016 [Nitrospira sp.]|nr:MAG: hypothetical protein LZF86_240016 [Nitrospira sp.]